MYPEYPRTLTSIIVWMIILIITLPISFAQPDDNPITIDLGWSHQFQFAGYYAALEKGYYSEVGLNVILKESNESEKIIEKVVFGDIDYGISTGTMLLSSVYNNKITVLAAILQQSPVTLLTLEGSGIKKLSDLKGRTITAGTEIKSMLISAGVSLDSINITGQSSDIDLLLNGSHHAIINYIIDRPYNRARTKLNFKEFRPIEYGLAFYGECLYTNLENSKNNPKQLDKLLTATIRGWEYALNNQEEIVDILINKYQVKFTKQQLLEEANILKELLILPSLYPIGTMDKTRWVQMVNILNPMGIIESDFSLDDFIYSKENQDNLFFRRLLIVVSILASGVSIGIVALYLFNIRLRKAVAQRTMSLNAALKSEEKLIDKLEYKVHERTKVIEEQKEELERTNANLEHRVTERTENLHKTNQELDRFVYSMSHDIKAPLASMQGLIEVIRIDPENKEKYIDLIEDSILQLDTFITEILEYSRNTRKEIEYSEIDIALLIDSVVTGLRYMKGAEKVELIKNINIDEPIVSDKMRIFVLLRNFISNSIKYQNEQIGNPYIKITVQAVNSRIMLKFEDNGIGIQEEHLDHIYDMFYRANEKSKGSGLGLYIVKETVEAMKGEVKVKSGINTGTTFIVELPNNKLPISKKNEKIKSS